METDPMEPRTVSTPHDQPRGPAALFACGTLRSSQRNRFALLLHRHSRPLGRATLRGRLYRLGEYPGAVPSDDPAERVAGEVFALDPEHAAEVIRALDEYEGADFARREVEVALDSGGTARCWAYLYTGSLEWSERIASGDWLAP
jgi:gamma-glutamylcyclotransferase (GGCT)/AIG2-like uncharacterized protein YtfP